MPRYGQLVVGPAGCGKSTFCSRMMRHSEAVRRRINICNLDPAAEYFHYQPDVDIRDLISIDDVMSDTELALGPNGGLMFCMEYLLNNFDWLLTELGEDSEDDYWLFDCAGQIELYTHQPIMKQLASRLAEQNFRMCAVYVLDSQFLLEPSKFVSGALSALSCMVHLEVACVSVITKYDLLSAASRRQVERFLVPDYRDILLDDRAHPSTAAFRSLTDAIAQLLEDYSMLKFVPFDINDDESVADLLLQIDLAIQFGEDQEPREPHFEQADRYGSEPAADDDDE